MLRRIKRWYCNHIDWHVWMQEDKGIRCSRCGHFRTLPNFNPEHMARAMAWYRNGG